MSVIASSGGYRWFDSVREAYEFRVIGKSLPSSALSSVHKFTKHHLPSVTRPHTTLTPSLPLLPPRISTTLLVCVTEDTTYHHCSSSHFHYPCAVYAVYAVYAVCEEPSPTLVESSSQQSAVSSQQSAVSSQQSYSYVCRIQLMTTFTTTATEHKHEH